MQFREDVKDKVRATAGKRIEAAYFTRVSADGGQE